MCSFNSVQVSVITTIGFLKEAPHVNIHGFNVYHKNRLILVTLLIILSLSALQRKNASNFIGFNAPMKFCRDGRFAQR